MCGIAGVFGAALDAAVRAVDNMNAAQRHRGPDGAGRQILHTPGGSLCLGHRRLSILDLSSAGQQPMHNPATGDWIVYNGEVYNHRELRRELANRGVRFRSSTDTEVVLQAFARWGTNCFDRLHGMFAVAIYDQQGQRLVLARDPLGIKPLYYTLQNRVLVFASELKALRASGLVTPEIDRRAVSTLLAYGAVPAPLTMYKDVCPVNVGSWCSYDLSTSPKDSVSRSKRFWSFPQLQPRPAHEPLLAEVRQQLQRAVCSHMISDVPVGVFLSGGVDSTAIAALSAEHAPEAINTFTVQFADQADLDEDPIATETARLLGTRHHRVSLTDTEALQLGLRWLALSDQPSLDGLNTFIISSAVKSRGLKVALSGLGGDELFGGYRSFRQVPSLRKWLRLAQAVPAALRSRVAAWPYQSQTQKHKARELATSSPTIHNLALRRRRLFSDFEINQFGFERDGLDLTEDYLPEESVPQAGLAGLDDTAAISVLECRFYMGNMLLRDADVCGMAHGVEIRVPLLDRQLVNLVMSLPAASRPTGGPTNKPLLANAIDPRWMRDIPRMRKRGFSLPYAHWMRGPLREQFQHHLSSVAAAGFVPETSIHHLWESMVKDQRGPTWSRVWLLGVLGAWLEREAASHPAVRAA